MKLPPELNANRIILLAFFALAVYASYTLIAPFMQPIMLALLIGLLAAPLHRRIVKLLRGRRSLAALLSCLLLIHVVLMPVMMLTAVVLQQGISYAQIVGDWATADNVHNLLNHPILLRLQSMLAQVLPADAMAADALRDQALAMAGEMGKRFATFSTAVLGSVTSFAFNSLLLVFVLYFVLRDHEHVLAFVRRAVPLSRSQEDLLLREVRNVSRSALLGSLATAVTQGMVGGFGLWLCGFPGLFWGTVMAFTSLVPVVGTAIVWVPATIYLLVTGEYGWALFLALWGVFVVGAIDNFLRPLLMQGSEMNTVVVFFALLGGLRIFGLMGLIYGPLIIAITLVFFRLYEQAFAGFLARQDRS